ncbi:MAG: beta-N-acetylhexosaminidase [Haliscomenobacteraceae bacterium CHB4]|nr:Beta-hexosaminidase [Saprospiraceae bacterium]MCE7925317.1 beta-N-acetylhexosaminidase [Haliscomenobacteraceae bacterium CHB4]
MHRIILTSLIFSALLALSANNPVRPFDFSRNFDPREGRWVDSVFNALSDDERFGQLFMLRAHADKDAAYEQQVEDFIRRYKPGGLCFFNPTLAGTVEKQAELTNRYQAASPHLPLMIAGDYENGIGMRLRSSAISYPRAMMLGAVQDNKLIYEMGRDIARQCRRLGVQVNFAPDVDVNNNAANPVINERSYGEDRANVTAKAFQYMMGLQDGGVLACAKHFPGHGDTDMDSHFDLPLIAHDRQRLDSIELFPFRALAQAGVGSVMVAHLSVPALDNRPNRPTTLSEPTIETLLREQICFEGLIFTDAMEMQGVTKHFKPGEADVEALRAGNDVVLLPADVDAAMSAIKTALADGRLDRERLNASVKRVLRAKYRLGLTTPQRVDLTNLRRDLNLPEYLAHKRRLIAHALTLVRDNTGLTGFPGLEKHRIATLALGDTNRTIFQTYCGYYARVSHFNAGKEVDSTLAANLLDTLRQFDVVLASFHNTRTKASDNFGLSDSQVQLVRRLDSLTTVAVTMFGNPYSLKYFDDVPVLLQAFTEDPPAQELAAQSLFGANDLSGKLPVTASASAQFGQGIQKTFAQKRLGYDLPESVGMSSDTLELMDDLVEELIRTGAAPGCQILVAKDGKVVWHKAYGYFTYEQTMPVTTESIYDLASVTKVAATTISAMRLVENGQLDLDSTMACYVPELLATDKKSLKIREILAHHAGLQAWIPFYKFTLENGLPDAHIYHRQKDHDSDIPVAPGMFMENKRADWLWDTLFRSPLLPEKRYKYSDLGLYLTARAIERSSGLSVDRYAEQYFYRPLGLATMTYNPWEKGWADRCPPTEEDAYFRHQRIQGYVHDMGAAMLGGVSGHAGLFSNANDLARVFQMLLNGGSYGGKQYLRPETVKLFTTRANGSTRRGIGFDMKELNPQESQNMSALAGPNTFGHMGFTGIGVWADPDKNLIFMFLSNRTYPTMENGKLIDGNYRPKLQSVVYRALKQNQ